MKRLYLSSRDKKIAGVCGGMGEYFNLDSTVIRVGYILLTIMTGFFPGILVYIICMAIIPNSEGPL